MSISRHAVAPWRDQSHSSMEERETRSLTLDVILELEADARHIIRWTYLFAVLEFSFSLGKKAHRTLTFKSVTHVVLNVERHP